MDSLSALPISTAAGPARLRRPGSVTRFVLLVLFWNEVAFAIGLWGFYVDRRPDLGSPWGLACWIGMHLSSPHSVLRPAALFGGTVLGAVHYLASCYIPTGTGGRLLALEKRITRIAVFLLALVPVLHLAWFLRAGSLMSTCFGSDLYTDLQVLDSRQDHEAMVRRMEEECIAFQAAKAGLWGDYKPREPSGGGNSFLFVTLIATHGEPFQLNAPQLLASYLGSYETAGCYPPPESSKPLARVMAESKVPVIRLTGLWWLDRRDEFKAEVDALVEGGDLSFQSWKDLKG